MKKREFLGPLAISIAALLGSTNTVGVVPNIRPETTITETTTGAGQQLPSFVLERPVPGKLQQHADHYSHMSHSSHSSHSSHRSGY